MTSVARKVSYARGYSEAARGTRTWGGYAVAHSRGVRVRCVSRRVRVRHAMVICCRFTAAAVQ
jgi:hypothetical protein